MSGPHLVSFVATDSYDCGGAHPDSSSQALVYDLNTGTPVDWAAYLPKSLLRTKATTHAADGTILGTIAGAALTKLYIEAVRPDEIDASCRDALSEASLNFLVWPDVKANGLVLMQTDLPFVVAVCGPAATIPMVKLRQIGVSSRLLDSIATAHDAGR